MYDHTDPLFQQHKILPFKQHVMLRKAIFMWKLANGYVPEVVTKLFTPNLHNQLKFVLPHPGNDKAKSYFIYSCITAWNFVPDSLKIITTLSNFSQKYENHLLSSL